MSDVIIIDGSNFFLRAFYAMSDPLQNSKGQETTAIFVFLNTLRIRLTEERPREVYIVFDFGKDVRKKALYKDYKANRKIDTSILSEMDLQKHVEKAESMRRQKSVIIDILKTLPIKLVLLKQIEGDSLIAYVARHFADRGQTVTIVSNDRDFYQLLYRRNISMWNPHKKIRIDVDNLAEVSKVDIPPLSWRVFKSMVGDSGDNILGIERVGEKTGEKIIKSITESGYDEPVTVDQLLVPFEGDEDDRNRDIRKKFGKFFNDGNQALVRMNYELVDLVDCTFSPQALEIIYKAIESKPSYSKMEFIQHLMQENINTILSGVDRFTSPFQELLVKPAS